MIEPIEYAPEFIKKIAKDKAPDAVAYAMIRMYDDVSDDVSDLTKHPSLRDRTKEMTLAVMGMAGKQESISFTATGTELYDTYGFEARGAAFVHTFKIMFA
jgi:hypothetical protein